MRIRRKELPLLLELGAGFSTEELSVRSDVLLYNQFSVAIFC